MSYAARVSLVLNQLHSKRSRHALHTARNRCTQPGTDAHSPEHSPYPALGKKCAWCTEAPRPLKPLQPKQARWQLPLRSANDLRSASETGQEYYQEMCVSRALSAPVR